MNLPVEAPQLDEPTGNAGPADPTPDAPPAQATAHDAAANPPADEAEGADDDAQLDALYDTLRSGKDRETARQSYRPTQQKPAPTETAPAAGDQAQPGTTPAPAVAQPAAPELDAEDAGLLSRFHVKPATFAKLDADERGELLANLRTRHNQQVQMFQELQTLKRSGGQPAPTPPQATQSPATTPAVAPTDPLAVLEAAWKANYGDDVPLVPQLRAAIEGMVNPLQAQLTKAEQLAQQGQAFMQQAVRDQEESDRAAGINAIRDLATKATVNLDRRTAEGKANEAKLLQAAQRFLNAEQMRLGDQWNRQVYNYTHAISDAFSTTFHPQNILAQRRQAADVAVQTARRGGDPSGLPARGQPPRSEDDVLDEVFEATRTHGRDAGRRIAAGRS